MMFKVAKTGHVKRKPSLSNMANNNLHLSGGQNPGSTICLPSRALLAKQPFGRRDPTGTPKHWPRTRTCFCSLCGAMAKHGVPRPTQCNEGICWMAQPSFLHKFNLLRPACNWSVAGPPPPSQQNKHQHRVVSPTVPCRILGPIDSAESVAEKLIILPFDPPLKVGKKNCWFS